MNEKHMTLLRDYDGRKVAGWLAQEKYDGCRAYWDGSAMWTRGGNAVSIPQHWRGHLPDFALDGEIWAGRGQFQHARIATQNGLFSGSVVFVAFDAPDLPGPFAVRHAGLEASLDARGPLRVAPVQRLASQADAFALLASVQAAGGEGLVLRDPLAPYVRGRSSAALRLK